MIERPEITFQKFAETGLSQLKSPDLRKNHIISVYKETNRLVDDYTYFIDENGLYWLTEDDIPQKIYVKNTIDRSSNVRKKEGEHFDKLEKWALIADEGTAIWFSPDANSPYPCSKAIFHRISYSVRSDLKLPIKALAISSINIDIPENDLKQFVSKLMSDKSAQPIDDVRSGMIILKDDQDLFLLIDEIYKYNKNIKDKPKTLLSNSDVEKKAYYISGMFDLGYSSWTITRKTKDEGLLGQHSISCGGTSSMSLSGSVYSETLTLSYGYEDQYGSLQFACPICKMINTRPFGQLISNCQFCGGNVSC